MVQGIRIGADRARNLLSEIAASFALLLLFAPSSGAATYKVDPEHTRVLFNVRRMFTTVTGRFEKFQGKITFDESDPAKTYVEGTIEAASVDTDVAKRGPRRSHRSRPLPVADLQAAQAGLQRGGRVVLAFGKRYLPPDAKNACKGQGWLYVQSEGECSAKGESLLANSSASITG